MRIKIKVTKEIIRESKDCVYKFVPKSNDDLVNDITRQCAVSRAVVELLPDAFVFQTAIRFFNSFSDFEKVDAHTSIMLPPTATAWIKRFDASDPSEREQMEPIEFDINLPENLIDRIGLSEVHRILKGSKTLELCQ